MCPSDKYSSSGLLRGGPSIPTATCEIGGFRPVFDALDADRDGRISQDDLRRAVALGSGGAINIFAPITEDDIGPMIAAADADHNGYVEYEEFERVLTQQKRDGKGQRSSAGASNGRQCQGWAREVFKAMDRDGDGLVGAGDLATWLAAAGLPATDEDVRFMITAAGGGVDGGVGFEGIVRILALDVPAGQLAA